MKRIHTTYYKIYNEKVKKELKVASLSDLHFSYTITEEKLKAIIKFLNSYKPNYILFPGDLLDSTGMIENKEEYMRIKNWLKELGNTAPTLISLGSHDYYKKEKDENTGKTHWIYYYPKYFIEDVNTLNNVKILDNQKYEDDNVSIVGYTQSMDYFHPKTDKPKSILKPAPENKECMIKELNELKKTLIDSTNKNKLNLIMIHSPIYVNDPNIKDLLKEYDYVFSGHMHNGCVPPVLYEIWRSDKGLIAPNKSLFPNNERDTLKTNKDKLIVNGPLTTFQECTGQLQKFNILYPMYITQADFTNDKQYNTEKIYKKTKYEKY